MSTSSSIDGLLQDCLAAYESGLSPEACLARFPMHRDELEPLLRQAIALRVAYASEPREEFRSAARERMLFSTGRDVEAAFTATPDPAFVERTRDRVLEAAGASIRETLSDVPPPRLPFWANCRRRLLEAASRPRPRPQPQPRRAAAAGSGLVLRAGLSAAVITIAIFAGVMVMLLDTGTPSANAQLAELEQQIREIEEKARSGETIRAGQLQELAEKTSLLAGRVDPTAPEARRLADLIDRQMLVVPQVKVEPAAVIVLAQAQEQLTQADVKVAADGTSAATAANSTPNSTSTTAATPTPASTSTPRPTPTQAALRDDQVQVSPYMTDEQGRAWNEVRTNKVKFIVPSDWKLAGVQRDEQGVASLPSGILGITIERDPLIVMNVDLAAGRVSAFIQQQNVELRGAGVAGKVLTMSELLSLTDNDTAAQLSRFLTSIEVAAVN